MRSHTSVPVCRVLGWSFEPSNPVGSEYILMERACGRQLVDVWGEMNQLQQFRLVQCLVQLQSQLAALEFPAYGNMYFLPSEAQNSDLFVPMNDDYCVGPAYNASCSPQLSERAHAGPCMLSVCHQKIMLSIQFLRAGTHRSWPWIDRTGSCALRTFVARPSYTPFRHQIGTLRYTHDG